MNTGLRTFRCRTFQSRTFRPRTLAGPAGESDEGNTTRRLVLLGSSKTRISIEAASARRYTLEGSSP